MLTVRLNGKMLCIKDCRGLASVRGLMFDDMRGCDGALIYGGSIWMPFVKHNLDLVFLDAQRRVVGVQKAVPLTMNPATWRIYRCSAAKYCLELKEGIVKRKIAKVKVYE